MASPFLAGFPGGLMQGLDFGQQQALRQLKFQQAQQQMLQADQQQQALGVAAQALRQLPQQPTGFQQGVAQDITTSLSGGFPQGSGGGPDVLLPPSPSYGPSGGMGTAPPRLPSLQGGQYGGGLTSGLTLPQFQDALYNLESGRGRDVSTSPAGALGPMQVMPATARQYGFTPEQAATSREPGNAIAADLYQKYGGNTDLAAIAYNAGPGRADKIAAGAPLSSLPSETQNYLAKLHRDLDLNLGQSGGKLIQAGMPAPAVQESTQTARAAGREIDPSQWGVARLQTLMQAVDKVAPGAPDAVKMLALGQINKLAAPEDRMMLQAYMKENAQQLQLGLAKFRAEQAERGRQEVLAQRSVSEAERERHDRAMEQRAGAGGEKLEVSKSFDIVDDKGKVVRQVMARERRDQAGWVDSETGQPLTLEPGQHLKQITPTTSGGGRAGAQVLRQQIGGREVLSDLQNAVRLPIGTTTGLLGGHQPGTSILGALSGDLSRTLTSQDSQLMQASMASLTRELSVLMSPVYGGNYAAQQIEPLVPKEGDTFGTVLFKLARLSQSADNALEAISKSPILSNDQQEYAVDLRKQLTEAIPWTPQQAMDFARQGESGVSFGDFVKANIGGGNAAAGGNISQMSVDQLRSLTAPGARDKLTPDQIQQIQARIKQLQGGQ